MLYAHIVTCVCARVYVHMCTHTHQASIVDRALANELVVDFPLHTVSFSAHHTQYIFAITHCSTCRICPAGEFEVVGVR